MPGHYYGAVYPGYWTGFTGRRIQEQGGLAAALLGCYLMSNAHATMLGLYPLAPRCILAETPLREGEIVDGFAALRAADFADFDAAADVVWVHSMARARLGLTPARPVLPEDDTRVVLVNRLYREVVDNAFLEQFFHRYAFALHLKMLRSATGGPQQMRFTLLTEETDVRTEERTDVRTKAPARARRRPRQPVEKSAPWQQTFGTFELYKVIAREAIVKATLEDDDSIGNVADHFKRLCARRRIAYTGDLVTRAIAAVSGRR